MQHTWYKFAIVYTLDVRCFMDGNADGTGDLTGLNSRLDYLSAVGINCLLLLPFFPSPQQDAGYDITDHYSIDPRVGTSEDLLRLVRDMKRREMHLLMDLVISHTSIEHPWFKAARSDPHSPYRNYYIWLPERPANLAEDVTFGEQQKGNWEYDETAGAWYYHSFYPHQPDLNIANPEVQEEVKRIMKYWLDQGIAGFRLDAPSHMLRIKGNEPFIGDPHQVFRDLRTFATACNPEAILLASANARPEKYNETYGQGDQFHMLQNFFLNDYLFLALARQQATPLIQALEHMLPEDMVRYWQPANFLRNHDELDLSLLPDEEREEVYARFAPEEDMRIYGRGIRRRLAAMLRNHRGQLELAYSLLLTLPGTPVVHYGEEIGMGDELSLRDRDSIRTAMQWSNAKNGGFSAAPSQKLIRPALEAGDYGYRKVNVVDQLSDPGSFLNQLSLMIHTRRKLLPFGDGRPELIPVNNPAVMVHRCINAGRDQALAVHNFSATPCTITLPLKDAEVLQLVDAFDSKPFNVRSKKIELGPFGYKWFSWSTDM